MPLPLEMWVSRMHSKQSQYLSSRSETIQVCISSVFVLCLCLFFCEPQRINFSSLFIQIETQPGGETLTQSQSQSQWLFSSSSFSQSQLPSQREATGVLEPGTVCVICQDPPTLPHSSRCGHVCCLPCWETWLRTSLECPVCRTRTRPKQLTRLLPPSS